MSRRLRSTVVAGLAALVLLGLGAGTAVADEPPQYGPEWSTDQYGPEWDADNQYGPEWDADRNQDGVFSGLEKTVGRLGLFGR